MSDSLDRGDGVDDIKDGDLLGSLGERIAPSRPGCDRTRPARERSCSTLCRLSSRNLGHLGQSVGWLVLNFIPG